VYYRIKPHTPPYV